MLRNVFIITKRELIDSTRDWRIIAPILILTTAFPWLMQMTTDAALDFIEEYGAQIIPLRLIPFAMLLVGFFPITFSLVIALETFVGEKERNSLEPLLAMPVTDAELYLGKLIAAMTPPLFASYLGIAVYLGLIYFTLDYIPPAIVIIQTLIITTMEGLVMVAGAVVVSSHTTSVRAANLLASFIVVPMALLLQAESILLFWGKYVEMWSIVAIIFVIDIVVVRMGIRIFNREEILAREFDRLDLGLIWRKFLFFLLNPPDENKTQGYGVLPDKLPAPDFKRFYRHDIPRLIQLYRLPLITVFIVITAALIGGAIVASQFPLPPEILDADLSELNIGRGDATGELSEMREALRGILPGFSTLAIFFHNVRAIILSAFIAVFTFGTLPLLAIAFPMGIIGFIALEAHFLGYNPVLLLTTFILPHGILELPAAIIAYAFAVQIGAALMAPPEGMTVGEGLLLAVANFVKVFLLVCVPIFLIAAFIEANITPLTAMWFLGR